MEKAYEYITFMTSVTVNIVVKPTRHNVARSSLVQHAHIAATISAGRSVNDIIYNDKQQSSLIHRAADDVMTSA